MIGNVCRASKDQCMIISLFLSVWYAAFITHFITRYVFLSIFIRIRCSEVWTILFLKCRYLQLSFCRMKHFRPEFHTILPWDNKTFRRHSDYVQSYATCMWPVYYFLQQMWRQRNKPWDYVILIILLKNWNAVMNG